MASEEGITVSKAENLSEWYTQAVIKSGLADYAPVSGTIVYKPLSYGIWEQIQSFFDALIKSSGHKNVYFPMLIPENLLTKEAKHIEGFTPEVAWVTQGGSTPFAERLAIRPTSETLIMEMYSKWIRSHRDLPLLYNQWCSVVRWEFKHPKPFLRGREFLWQEGHTAHETYDEAEQEALLILEYYRRIHEELLALPVIYGLKSPNETFAGAHHTYTIEAWMPDGKALQMCTTHHMAENFSRPFDITFTDREGETRYAHTSSWGISTRTIGGVILTHGDDRGLVLPPRIAPTQVVIVPIYKDDSKAAVMEAALALKQSLSQSNRVELDAREYLSPGRKFNEHELKGTPLRIEIGPKDLEARSATLVRRDSLDKKQVGLDEVADAVGFTLDDIHASLFEKAKSMRDARIVDCSDLPSFAQAISEGKVVRAPWKVSSENEEKLEEETGASCRVIPQDQPLEKGVCVVSGVKADAIAYFSRSY